MAPIEQKIYTYVIPNMARFSNTPRQPNPSPTLFETSGAADKASRNAEIAGSGESIQRSGPLCVEYLLMT